MTDKPYIQYHITRKPAWFYWQDIATAPKDGTRVLLSNGSYVHIGCFIESAAWEHDEEDDKPHWVAWECEDYYYSFHLIGYYEPTKWMPLPIPPESMK